LPAEAYLLDVTRLASRLGRGALTGIDRVELAYLRHLSAVEVPCLGLLRTSAGIVVLRAEALVAIADWAAGAAIPVKRDLLARLSRQGSAMQGRIETALRAFAVVRAPMVLAGRVLAKVCPPGCVYLNVGHSNLSDRMMVALHRVPGLRIAIMVHDTIPLDYPAFTRQGQAEVFGRKLAVVSRHADIVLHTAPSTQRQTEIHLKALGRVPRPAMAALGVDLPVPDPSKVPDGVSLETPYFVAIGTIEPRKNHRLLLDVWDSMAQRNEPLPRLLILGNRGWADAALFARLDRGVPGVQVISGLSDGAMACVLQNARALLFPSLAEGFGLPPFEAAGMGVAVVSSDLSVIRDGLLDYPVYLDPSDSYSWMETILRYVAEDTPPRGMRSWFEVPSWETHFNIILRDL
jgi:glycosyltransferase involved in cell wall biosynthesis